jgi:D-alanyl-D-alanine carboxypeptidase
LHGNSRPPSRQNRVSARQLTALVAGVLGGEPTAARTFRGSLALSAERGTLEERMVGTAAAGRVQGKTGWIRGVSSLSGVCRTLDERELVFSILVEYPAAVGGLNTRCFKPMQDALVSALVEGAPRAQ